MRTALQPLTENRMTMDEFEKRFRSLLMVVDRGLCTVQTVVCLVFLCLEFAGVLFSKLIFEKENKVSN